MPEIKRVAIIAATGYTGHELVRLLLVHPSVKIVRLTSRQNEGQSFTKLFPQFRGFDLPLISTYDPDRLAQEADLAFFCLPHHESQAAVGAAVDRGLKAIDLSADFRLKKAPVYEKWYGPHERKDLIPKAVYGLPERYRREIKKAALVANPGCYPQGVILGVAPLIEAGLVEPGHVIADLKSGVSGAGRKAAVDYSFCEVVEDFRPYNLYAHRHTPEMEQELSRAAGKAVRVTFSPHLVPMSRGILGTIYVKLTKKADTKKLNAVLAKAYADETFVRVLEPGELPAVSRVRGSNFVDLAVTAAPGGREAIVSSAIDNLVKGASGSAVQCMNLMLGLPESMGLLQLPLKP